jgi:hypothetical protein
MITIKRIILFLDIILLFFSIFSLIFFSVASFYPFIDYPLLLLVIFNFCVLYNVIRPSYSIIYFVYNYFFRKIKIIIDKTYLLVIPSIIASVILIFSIIDIINKKSGLNRIISIIYPLLILIGLPLTIINVLMEKDKRHSIEKIFYSLFPVNILIILFIAYCLLD